MTTTTEQQSLTEGMSFAQDKKPAGNFRTSFYNPFEIKHRKRTSRAQFKVLEKTFQENPKPSASVRRWLAQQLVMTPRGVQVWFQNRRAKEKSNNAKKPASEPLVKEPSTSSYDTPVSSPSVCTCPDCFATPMTRTMSYLDEEIMTPVTPLDNYFFMNQQQPPRKFVPQWSPTWNFSPEEDAMLNPPMMRRFYTNNVIFDNRRSLEDKSIQSTEVIKKTAFIDRILLTH